MERIPESAIQETCGLVPTSLVKSQASVSKRTYLANKRDVPACPYL